MKHCKAVDEHRFVDYYRTAAGHDRGGRKGGGERTGRIDQGMSCGTAEVQSTTASVPSIAAFSPAESAVMSPSVSAVLAIPVSFTTFSAL
jgi:hypothetical protein